MRVTSKTGLLPSLKKKDRYETRETLPLEMPKMVVPAPFTLKPFAGIYNPFPYGCSILCNHPADLEAKSIVKKAKDAWTSEGKHVTDLQELSGLREKLSHRSAEIGQEPQIIDNVPEELFRKYTDTDSRPITPTPTLASTVTKHLRTRRCMTPDPTSFIPAEEKTLLVLDLRRSHSQDTVSWQANQTADCNFDNDLKQTVTSSTTSLSSINPPQVQKKKMDKKKPSLSSGGASLKTQTSKDSDSKAQTRHSSISQTPSKGSILQEQESSRKMSEASSDSLEESNVVKRRGKKSKKGKKTGKDGKAGEKEVQGIPDPGETQVSALENDSKEDSSRSSSAGEEKFPENQEGTPTEIQEPKPEVEETVKSFLNHDTLKRLQRQLDQEVVDSELNTKRKIALEEALRHKKNPKHEEQEEEMKSLKKEFRLVIKDSEKWLSIPRVFTRRSARFELPLDSRVLNNMKPIEYVQKYVYASPERLVLYNHVFNLHKEDPEDDEEKERVLLGKNVVQALGKVMGRPMTDEEAKDFQKILNWKDEDHLDFRTFTGICATCERLMCPRFCSVMLSQKEDPRHEIERADFERLDEKLFRISPDRNLVEMLKSIRDF